MPTKLNNASLKKKNSFKAAMQVAAAKKESIENIQEKNVEELPEEIRTKIITVKDADLLDDSYNQDYYGDLTELENMTQAMKDYGFQGIILAYPIDNGKYRIESGHRRRAAGRAAGLEEFPVYVTEAPQTDWERKIRLFMGNLHGRKESPLVIARVAQGLFDAHREEIKDKKAKGLLQEGEVTYANQIVANDLDLDLSSVEKYRALLRLIPELQNRADSGDYAWSELSSASTLSDGSQQKLENWINEKTLKDGVESVDRAYLHRVIGLLKAEERGEKKAETQKQSKTDFSVLKKNVKKMNFLLSAENSLDLKDIPDAIAFLTEMKNNLNQKIEELNHLIENEKVE